jgi:hypothetical protein
MSVSSGVQLVIRLKLSFVQLSIVMTPSRQLRVYVLSAVYKLHFNTCWAISCAQTAPHGVTIGSAKGIVVLMTYPTQKSGSTNVPISLCESLSQESGLPTSSSRMEDRAKYEKFPVGTSKSFVTDWFDGISKSVWLIH